MTIVSVGDDGIIEQIVKQVYKLVDVVKVTDLTATEHIERELLLVKISVAIDTQSKVVFQKCHPQRTADLCRHWVVAVVQHLAVKH
jgi:acetolactate synthase-1/3 small subunit